MAKEVDNGIFSTHFLILVTMVRLTSMLFFLSLISILSCKKIVEEGFVFMAVDDLSSDVKENSGIVVFRNQVFTHNDSGDGPFIYRFTIDNPTNLSRSLLKGADNTDWEDLAFDGENLYVFDTGSNKVRRKKMAYYSLPIENILGEEISNEQFSKIVFKFKNKNGKSINVNCEAATFLENKIFLISKTKSSKAKIYTLELGKDEAQYLSEVKIPFEITGATTYQNRIYFCGYDKFGDNVYLSQLGYLEKSLQEGWKKPKVTIFAGQFSGQCEGIYIEKDLVHLSTERGLLSPAKLYRMDLSILKERESAIQ